MKTRSRLDAWTAGAWLCALPALAAPIGDPDLWWHLNAARWMVAQRAFPRVEAFSFTLPGTPWVDFEWLSQLVLYAVHAGAGLAGLWALKLAALAAAGWALSRALAAVGVSASGRALALAFWAAVIIPRSDARPEMFSLAAFAWLFWRLEARGAGSDGERTRLPLVSFVFFALWANLHAGFVYGLFLLGVYAVDEAAERRCRVPLLVLAAGVLGSCATPYGVRLPLMLWEHLREAEGIQRLILEWAPLSLSRPGHWPSWLLLFGAGLAALAALLRGRPARPARLVTLAIFGLAALRHARVLGAFATLAVPFVAAAAAAHWGDLRPRLRAALDSRALRASAMAACGLWGLWLTWPAGTFLAVSHEQLLPVRAVRYLRAHPELRDLRLYHPWGWGGYLGYRLGPGTKVFQDGRYLFHGLLMEAGAASRSPEGWQGFLDRHGVDAALMENVPLFQETTRQYPDGTRRAFRRPFYLSFMPAGKWALVHWDDRGLLFVRRGVLAPERLAGLEYRLARPRDDEALADVLRRGEIDAALLERERARHEAESQAL